MIKNVEIKIELPHKWGKVKNYGTLERTKFRLHELRVMHTSVHP